MNVSEKNYSVRGLLIILVVFGHVLSKNPNSLISDYTYLFIYTFHMPLFILLSGYYGANVKDKNYLLIVWECITKLLVPFLIVSMLFRITKYIVFGNTITYTLFQKPTFAMWFILALIFYRLVTKLVVRIPNYLIVTLFISVFAQYFPEKLLNYADFTRIFSFIVFYFVGVRMRELNFNLNKFRIKKKHYLWILLVISLLINLYLTTAHFKYTESALKLDTVTFYTDLTIPMYLLTKVYVIGFAFINSLIIYNLIRPSYTLIYIGERSLNIYLGHIFFIVLMRADIYNKLVSRLGEIVMFVVSIFEVILIVLIILVVTQVYRKLNRKLYKKLKALKLSLS